LGRAASHGRRCQPLPPDVQGTPVVVAVDDVHLLDDLSTFVLHQILQRRAAKLLLTVRAGDGAELATVSEGFEEMGDLIAATDSAAHTALAYRGQGMRGSAFTHAARAEALAE
jgi:hypothetical protein